MPYVIRNNDTGACVARSGSEHSYTSKLEQIRTWSTREAAQEEDDRCSS